jgi:hypothetical protein
MNLDQVIAAAIELLPAKPAKVEFDAYKAQLQDAFPDSWHPAFTRMIKADLVAKELANGENGKPVVLVSRL